MYLKVHVTTKESIQRSVVRGRCLTGLKDMKECIYSMERTKDKREGITWSSPGTGPDAGQVSYVYAILDVDRSPGMRLGSLLQLVPWHSGVVWFLQRNLQLVPWHTGVVWFLVQLVPRQHPNAYGNTICVRPEFHRLLALHEWKGCECVWFVTCNLTELVTCCLSLIQIMVKFII